MAKGINIKKWTIPLLIGAFVLVLFFNTYFNYTSEVAINEDGESLTDRYYLAGPDPYYNARLVEQTAETGEYPYLGGVHGSEDPLLNYPLGRSGGRPPLFNVVTVSVGKFFSPIVGELDAMGNAMQFLPALYGALLVFPVYVIGSRLFNRKSGLLGAFFVALIPLHLSSGHGSAFSLYDHDSFVLLLTTTAMMFLVMSLKERNMQKSMLLAFMSGIAVASISLTWVAAQYIYTIIAVYAIAQMVLDILSSKIDIQVPRATLIALLGGYLLALPFYWYREGFTLTTPLAIALAVAAFSVIYIWLSRQNIPWVISIPSIFGIGGVGLVVLYLVRDTSITVLRPLTKIADVIFGAGIYGKKVSLTIAEASTFDFSRTVMSFGPVVFLMAALVGFPLLLYYYFKDRSRRDYFLILMWFMVELMLLSTAGRFLNNFVPLIAVLGGWVLWFAIDKIDFDGMVQSVKGVGGGWYGLKKGIKVRHLAGVFFVVFLVFIPNGWMALDASIPSTMKQDFDSDKLGAFGLGLHTEAYWTDAFMWLSQQDANQTNTEKPAFISWWDYGFYEVAMGGHPTVADNFQDGIPPAANFQTARNEQQAVTVWIIRLAEGDMDKNDGTLSDAVRAVFDQFLGNQSQDLVTIIENPEEYANTTYNDIIGEEYKGEQYRVQADNARYHDATELITQLTDEQITWFYHGMQNATGTSIRYYGVEGYDINIFNVFTFLADKGTFGYETAEDDYYKLFYVSETGQKYTPDELENMTDLERQQIGQLNAQTVRKDAFYNSMVYRTYLGASVTKEIFDNQTSSQQYQQYLYALMQPTVGLKHFSAEYVSPMNDEESLYFVRGSLCFGCPAVVIAKYYEGARITGTILSEGKPLAGAIIEVQRNVTLYNSSRGITHDATIANDNGVFSVIAPAGNITLIVSQGTGNNRVAIKKITFNGTGALAPISEADAMRRSDTWKRDIGTFNLKKGDVAGTVFWDKDGDGEYNATFDGLLSNVKIEIAGKTERTNAQGYYKIEDLLPNVYVINVTKEGYTVSGSSQVGVRPDEVATRNLSLLPTKVTVSGATWYDANNNGVINTNETLAQVSVKFAVLQAPDDNAGDVTVTSNATGYYTRNLSPATYSISINHTAIENNQTVRYTYEGTLPIDIGDSDITMTFKLARVEE